MRIAVISRALIPGGLVEWATGLARGFIALGHDAHLVFVRDSGMDSLFAPNLSNLEVENVLTGSFARLSEAIGWPFSLALLQGGYGREGSPDPLSWAIAPLIGRWSARYDLLVFAEDFTGLGGCVLNLLRGRTYAVFVHEAQAQEASFLADRILDRMRRTVRTRAALVCGINEAITDRLRAAGERNCRTVTSGCEPGEPTGSRSNFVLADSRWTPARNPEFLIDIARAAPQAQFVMLGSFWTPAFERDFLVKCREAGVADRVRVVTSFPAAYGLDLYRTALVYVRWAARGTAGWEAGFPTGLRTAMSNSCPVLFDRNLGCAALLRSELPDSELDHSPAAFAAGIGALLNSPRLVTERSQQARHFAMNHTWAHSASVLLDGLK